jgi:twinkle protein|tara:strand:+ start:2051 stop:3802 length:1752 start_codon:yes stop_codon:yes gene_type:complete
MDVNQDIKSSTNNLSHGQHKIVCPLCADTRKKKRDKSLSVNIDGERIVYNCHHCGSNGAVNNKSSWSKPKMQVVKQQPKKQEPIELPKQDDIQESLAWLENRGISKQIASKTGVVLGKKKYKPVIGFSYASAKGDVYAVKWRVANGDKIFWWEGNAQKLWGNNPKNKDLEDVESTIVITEGEMDCLAIKESFKDYANIDVYSVPHGASSKITDGVLDPSEDKKFAYLWEEREKFEGIERIIIATDNDEAGDVLAQELSRRLNIARCYRMDYKGKKDSNDVLMLDGAETLRNMVLEAKPIPLHGLNSMDFYADEFQNLYEQGKPTGASTGYPSVDELFTLSTGNLIITTGYPSEGKSAFIDQLIINLARQSGWKTCFCSFEKPPSLHAVQLSQILTGKPFFEGANERMNQEEKDFAETWIKEHILFQDYKGGELPTIEAILEKGASAVMRYGIRVLVIDPYNFVHNDKGGLETETISNILTKVQLFAKQHQCLVFFVAHPNKPFVRDGKKNVCTGVDISGSMAWFSKADMGLTVYRGEESVEIHCWKARWGWNGRLGSVKLIFNPVNGRYEEYETVADDFDWDF